MSLIRRLIDHLFSVPPDPVWTVVSETYLRDDQDIHCDWFGPTYYEVYLVTETSGSSKRVREDWRRKADQTLPTRAASSH